MANHAWLVLCGMCLLPIPNYLLKQTPTTAPKTIPLDVMKDDTSSLFQKMPDGQFSRALLRILERLTMKDLGNELNSTECPHS
ncbi:MAG: hypothetical protein WA461_01020 [Nitrososphaeraceae archaeon]